MDRGSRFVRATLVAMLLAIPVAASAAGWWCWIPFWPGCGDDVCGKPLTHVEDFGRNPGNLEMCTYVPKDLGPSRPLVIALHGCTQRASSYDDEPGWTRFADEHRFALLLPQQTQANHPRKCFNWYEPAHHERDAGEALSIRNMIDKILDDADVDPSRIYVTGLSAGGAMTAVLLATYPELFAGGAIMAGVPYDCADGPVEALTSCGYSALPGQLGAMKDLTPAQWGDRVRSASGHLGTFPPVSIWHGAADTTVNPLDQRELMEQWTNVLGIDQIPDSEDTIDGHRHEVYRDDSGKALVETVLVNGMAHGTPIDPGTGEGQCGKAAPYILDASVCSTYHIVKFWGLDAVAPAETTVSKTGPNAYGPNANR
jgi:poly(hydroxyalkanoate) depolymerase family esterase